MSRRTNPEKQARKTAFRIARTEAIERIKRERQEAFNEMFADVIEKTPVQDIDAIAGLSDSIDPARLFVGDEK